MTAEDNGHVQSEVYLRPWSTTGLHQFIPVRHQGRFHAPSFNSIKILLTCLLIVIDLIHLDAPAGGYVDVILPLIQYLSRYLSIHQGIHWNQLV